MDTIGREVEAEGYALVPKCISEDTIQILERAIDCDRAGVRNLLSNEVVGNIVGSDEVRRNVASVLGDGCFAVKGIFFNKTPQANWKVTWHQDCVIAGREKLDIEGWGPWSNKAGVVHVRPTVGVLTQMIAIRIHLDHCLEDNGPLRVIPGSHLDGILSDAEIQDRSKENAVDCLAKRGDAILMRPLYPAFIPSCDGAF